MKEQDDVECGCGDETPPRKKYLKASGLYFRMMTDFFLAACRRLSVAVHSVKKRYRPFTWYAVHLLSVSTVSTYEYRPYINSNSDVSKRRLLIGFSTRASCRPAPHKNTKRVSGNIMQTNRPSPSRFCHLQFPIIH